MEKSERIEESRQGIPEWVDLGDYSCIHKLTLYGAAGEMAVGKFCTIDSLYVMYEFAPQDAPALYAPLFNGQRAAAIFGDDIDLLDKSVMAGNIVIGNDVRMYGDVFISGGVTVGHGSVIMPGAYLLRDVEPYTVVGGNPQYEIRKRLPPLVTAGMLSLRWWDWAPAKIRQNIEYLRGDRPVRDLLRRYGVAV